LNKGKVNNPTITIVDGEQNRVKRIKNAIIQEDSKVILDKEGIMKAPWKEIILSREQVKAMLSLVAFNRIDVRYSSTFSFSTMTISTAILFAAGYIEKIGRGQNMKIVLTEKGEAVYQDMKGMVLGDKTFQDVFADKCFRILKYMWEDTRGILPTLIIEFLQRTDRQTSLQNADYLMNKCLKCEIFSDKMIWRRDCHAQVLINYISESLLPTFLSDSDSKIVKMAKRRYKELTRDKVNIK